MPRFTVHWATLRHHDSGAFVVRTQPFIEYLCLPVQPTRGGGTRPAESPSHEVQRVKVGQLVPGEPHSFPLVGPCEVRKEGPQRLEGLSVVIAARANHVCFQA